MRLITPHKQRLTFQKYGRGHRYQDDNDRHPEDSEEHLGDGNLFRMEQTSQRPLQKQRNPAPREACPNITSTCEYFPQTIFPFSGSDAVGAAPAQTTVQRKTRLAVKYYPKEEVVKVQQ